MRRDFFIQNDSGGLSVLSGAAVEEIINDGRNDDMQFVSSHRAILLELYGDDSMPVRVVSDEPLSQEEESQWLACVRWKIDAPDGRVLIAGGFDPDSLAAWAEEAGPDGDSQGVAVCNVAPGLWRADLYAHVGSMNGRELLGQGSKKVGAWFRSEHPGAPFPLWLVRMLSFSGEDDPGYEELWNDPESNIRAGKLQADLGRRGFIGFLLHLQRDEKTALSPEPEGGWFSLDTGSREPQNFPLGLAAGVADPELASIAECILNEGEPAAEDQLGE